MFTSVATWIILICLVLMVLACVIAAKLLVMKKEAKRIELNCSKFKRKKPPKIDYTLFVFPSRHEASYASKLRNQMLGMRRSM